MTQMHGLTEETRADLAKGWSYLAQAYQRLGYTDTAIECSRRANDIRAQCIVHVRSERRERNAILRALLMIAGACIIGAMIVAAVGIE